jgi:hypothetical protein
MSERSCTKLKQVLVRLIRVPFVVGPAWAYNLPMRLFALLIGCGFQTLPNPGPDLASPDLGSAPADLAGADLAGVDFAAPAADLAAPDLSAAKHQGPGPLGALPAGYCCQNDQECRSRDCVNAGSFRYCSDLCDSDEVCNVWGAGFACDLPSQACVATGASCHPAADYQYGTAATGSCCAHGFATAGQECLGGICTSTGNSANPFYCTQGCDNLTHCPGGYSCLGGTCWITQTTGDPSYLYSCQ